MIMIMQVTNIVYTTTTRLLQVSEQPTCTKLYWRDLEC